MKSSKILREAALWVEQGRRGLFSATRYMDADDGKKIELHIREVLPQIGASGFYRFSPFDLPQDHRATILCLAAAIAESEGD